MAVLSLRRPKKNSHRRNQGAYRRDNFFSLFRHAAFSEYVTEPSSSRTDLLTRPLPSPSSAFLCPQPLPDSLSPTPIFLHHIRRHFVSPLAHSRSPTRPAAIRSPDPRPSPHLAGASPLLSSPGSSSASVRPASHACLPPSSPATSLTPLSQHHTRPFPRKVLRAFGNDRCSPPSGARPRPRFSLRGVCGTDEPEGAGTSLAGVSERSNRSSRRTIPSGLGGGNPKDRRCVSRKFRFPGKRK